MKKLILTGAVLWLALGIMHSQTMSWVPSDYVADSESCANMTDCSKNVVCYQLQYQPAQSGKLTSYTTGFITDCSSGISSILRNESCIMNDNSMEIEACQEYSKLLLHCSGNSGEEIYVEAGRPIMLHQVCFQLEQAGGVELIEAEVADLTTSLDDLNGGLAITEFPDFLPFEAISRHMCHPDRNEMNPEILQEEVTGETVVSWSPVSETGQGQYQLEMAIIGNPFEAVLEIDDLNYDPYNWRYEVALPNLADYDLLRISYSSPNTTNQYSNIIYRNGTAPINGERFLQLSPNPTQEILNYSLQLDHQVEGFEIQISDVSGKMYFRRSDTSQQNGQLEVSDWPAGVYLFIVSLADGTILNQHFIKQR